jgi:hypothetical protein
MKLCWKYALLGVGHQERVYACRESTVYVASPNLPNVGWAPLHEAVPARAVWWTEEAGKMIFRPKDAVDFVIKRECGVFEEEAS